MVLELLLLSLQRLLLALEAGVYPTEAVGAFLPELGDLRVLLVLLVVVSLVLCVLVLWSTGRVVSAMAGETR